MTRIKIVERHKGLFTLWQKENNISNGKYEKGILKFFWNIWSQNFKGNTQS